MSTGGRNTVGSQFYISFAPCSHLNGLCPVIGRLVEGDDVLKQIEQVLFLHRFYYFHFYLQVYTVRMSPVRKIVLHSCGIEK